MLLPVTEIISLVLAMPGVFILLGFMALASLSVMLTVKTIISGAILAVSGAAYALAGIWILLGSASVAIQILSFVLLVFGVGQLAFGIDMILTFKRKHGKPEI